MHPSPLLPTRGIFIPTHMLCHPQMPPSLLLTWIQLRSLAWRGCSTPDLSLRELAEITGRGKVTLSRHMDRLIQLGTLERRSTQPGRFILTFPDPVDVASSRQREKSKIGGNKMTTQCVLPVAEPASYFPEQILGYLTFPDPPIGSLSAPPLTSQPMKEEVVLQDCRASGFLPGK